MKVTFIANLHKYNPIPSRRQPEWEKHHETTIGLGKRQRTRKKGRREKTEKKKEKRKS
jgi:hypothetical protein